MTVHELKCWPEPFAALKAGTKTAEWRLNDRNYQVGDILHQREWDPATKDYTGDAVDHIVTHIIGEGFNIPNGYVMMSIRPLEAEAGVAALREALQSFPQVPDYLDGLDCKDEEVVEVLVTVGEMRKAVAALSSTNAGRSILDHIKALEEQTKGLKDHLGVIAHEMEVFCDSNCTATVNAEVFSQSLSMIDRWRTLIALGCTANTGQALTPSTEEVK